MLERTLERYVDTFLKTYRKMVFLSGPRQVGKTTLARRYSEKVGGGVYFNWDVITDQRKLVRNPYFFEDADRTLNNLVILDEIHKYAKWRNYLKGAHDRFGDEFLFIVLGSGRLDLFRKGGDSLLGRTVPLPLFPFTLSEMQGRFVAWDAFKAHLKKGPPAAASSGAEYRALFDMGGFPEPLTRQDMAFGRIWRQERKTLLVRSDIRDATGIRDISLLEVLSHLVADRVGSPLSINALREELGVAFETARDWIRTLAAFYYLFQIHPFTGSLARTLRKETKAYLFDWAELDDPGLRFENLVASHLLKAVRTWTSIGEGNPELRYIRDREKREVDFVVVEKKKPLCLIESRLGSGDFSEHLLYYQEKLNVPAAVQLVHKSGVMRKRTRQGRVQWLLSADRWLTCLP